MIFFNKLKYWQSGGALDLFLNSFSQNGSGSLRLYEECWLFSSLTTTWMSFWTLTGSFYCKKMLWSNLFLLAVCLGSMCQVNFQPVFCMLAKTFAFGAIWSLSSGFIAAPERLMVVLTTDSDTWPGELWPLSLPILSVRVEISVLVDLKLCRILSNFWLSSEHKVLLYT